MIVNQINKLLNKYKDCQFKRIVVDFTYTGAETGFLSFTLDKKRYLLWKQDRNEEGYDSDEEYEENENFFENSHEYILDFCKNFNESLKILIINFNVEDGDFDINFIDDIFFPKLEVIKLSTRNGGYFGDSDDENLSQYIKDILYILDFNDDDFNFICLQDNEEPCGDICCRYYPSEDRPNKHIKI